MTAVMQAAPRIAERKPEEFAGLPEALRREREWFTHHPVYPTLASIDQAVSQKQLVYVSSDENISPIARLRNYAKPEYPSFLSPTSRLALGAIGSLWRAELGRRGIDRPDLRLAATSFVRSVAMQQVLIESGALAADRSTHCVGFAFDIDESAYYSFLPDSGLVTVTHPDRPRNLVKAIAQHLHTRDSYHSPASAEAYDAEITSSLGFVLDQLHADGQINRIHEFAGTYSQCAHVAPNPSVSPSVWNALRAGNAMPAWMG